MNGTKALDSVDVVKTGKVSVDYGLAVVDGTADTERLIKSVKKAGYDATSSE